MHYRVEAAERPDAQYTVWQGGVYRAQRSTADGTVLLVALPGEQAPPEFDTTWESKQAKIVPEAEVSATFSVQTHCVFDDEIYRVSPDDGESPGPLVLRWSGTDEALAAQLGLTDFSTKATLDDLSALWQERHDFTDPASPPPEPVPGDPNPFLRGIGRALLKIAPAKWNSIAAQYRQIGGYAELEVRSVLGDPVDEVTFLSPPPTLSQLFAALRAAMYEPGSGTWFQSTFVLKSSREFDFDYDLDRQPDWRQPPHEGAQPAPAAYQADLALYPREPGHVPPWLAAKAGLPVSVAFRQAAVVDGPPEGDKPTVNRPPVPPEELRGVLDYLFRSPVALARPGRLPDLFAPTGKPDVPDAFHTDGTWIWPAAVPHYLRKYRVPPQPELVEHIRAAGFRPPYVPEPVRAAAEAELVGAERPVHSVAELTEPGTPAMVDRGQWPRTLLASDVLTILRRRLAEYGVAESAYSIGKRAKGVWSLARTEHSWEVSGPDDEDPAAFAHLEEAARFLLGTLLLYPARAFAGAPEPAEPADRMPDWPILPLRGEPPLFLFRRKRVVVLAPGTALVRFGPDGGNLVHDEAVTFPETALPPERQGLRQALVVRRPLRVLAGVALPWGPMPGGAVGYFLPRPVGHHLETGALERLTTP